MALADLLLPIPYEYFGEPPVNVVELYEPTTDYIILGLAQTERIRPRDQHVVPTIQVTFAVPGLPGTFTIHIDNYAFEHADPPSYMVDRVDTIRQLYAL